MLFFRDYVLLKKQNPPKFFIEWAPNPDPLYHSPADSPLEMPIHPPLPNAPIPVDGYMISLDHLVGGRAKRKFQQVASKYGLHHVLKFKGPVILDSGGYQNKHRNPINVLELQSIFKPDFVIHMDVLGDYKQTIKNALLTKAYEECFDFKIYYVIQGRNISEFTKCANILVKNGCLRFAIGNLSHLSYLRRNEMIREIVSAIKRIIGDRPLHLLGVSNPKLILELKGLITSFDSSTGIRNATRLREVFELKNNEIIYFRKIDKRPREFTCNCPICQVFNVFENEYKYPKGTGERRKIRFARAIHNTYVIWKAINSNNSL
ncbi:MAG: hypothetical protein QXD95_07250 [Nitrososphaeria archaeon]